MVVGNARESGGGGGWRVVCVSATTISNKYSNSD